MGSYPEGLSPEGLSPEGLTPDLLSSSYSTVPDYQEVLIGYTNLADSETDVVGIASRQLAVLLLIVVGLLFVSTVTLYVVKRCHARFITLPAISLVYGGLGLGHLSNKPNVY